MTCLADLVIYGVTGERSLGWARFPYDDVAHRLNARQHILVAFVRTEPTARDQLRDEQDHDDRYDERQHDNDDQLLWRLDRRRVRVVFRHVLVGAESAMGRLWADSATKNYTVATCGNRPDERRFSDSR